VTAPTESALPAAALSLPSHLMGAQSFANLARPAWGVFEGAQRSCMPGTVDGCPASARCRWPTILSSPSDGRAVPMPSSFPPGNANVPPTSSCFCRSAAGRAPGGMGLWARLCVELVLGRLASAFPPAAPLWRTPANRCGRPPVLGAAAAAASVQHPDGTDRFLSPVNADDVAGSLVAGARTEPEYPSMQIWRAQLFCLSVNDEDTKICCHRLTPLRFVRRGAHHDP